MPFLSGPIDHRGRRISLSSGDQNIQFTREMERCSHLPSLDMNIYRRHDGCVGYNFYCKAMHTIICVSSGPYFHSSNNHVFLLSALMDRTRLLCDLHNDWSFCRSLPGRMTVATSKFVGFSVLYPVTWLSFCLVYLRPHSMVISLHNSFGFLPRNISTLYCLVKYDVGWNMFLVYVIHCCYY
jgi:hypothetical protein